MRRRTLTKKDKEEIGLKCCNCGSEEDLQYHHIIPLSLGGNDINSNMCCLCYKCHYKLHHNGKDSKVANYGELIKNGKARAKQKEGFTDGRPKKKNKEQIQQMLQLLTVNGGNMSYSQVSELYDISSRTLMRYQKEYSNK